MVGDSNTWWKAVVNELGRITNGLDNWVRVTKKFNLSERNKYQRVAQSHMQILCVITSHLNKKHSESY